MRVAPPAHPACQKLLYVFPPHANVRAVAVVFVNLIVDVHCVRVIPVEVLLLHTVPVPDISHVPDPIVNDLVLALFELQTHHIVTF